MKKYLKFLLPLFCLGASVAITAPFIVSCRRTTSASVGPNIDWSKYRGRFWAVMHTKQELHFTSINLSFVFQDYNPEEKFDKWSKPVANSTYQLYTIAKEDDWIKVEHLDANYSFIENSFKDIKDRLHYKFDYFIDLTNVL